MNDEANQLGTAMLRLQQWYQNECNGDWEHSFGLSVETLDNPGWLISIDLEETAWAGAVIPLARFERSDTDWMQYEFTDTKFTGCGGVGNLAEIIEAFFEVVK